MRASIARATLMLLLLTTPHLADAQNVDWRHYGGDPGNTHWSELKQISTANVQKLKAAWVLQLGTLRAQESTPLVVGDTLYVTSSFGPKHVFAVDGRTGELRWRHDAEIAADVDPYGCCDVNSRGLAYANGKRDFETLPARVPVFYGVYSSVGHGGTYNEDNGGAFGMAAVAWLKWQLKNDTSASGKAYFVGTTCGLCGNSQWKVDSRSLR